MVRRFLSALFVSLAVLLAPSAWADPPPPSGQTTAVPGLIKSVPAKLKAKRDVFVRDGMTLAGALALLMFSWLAVSRWVWGENFSQTVGEWIILGLQVGILAAVMQNYGQGGVLDIAGQTSATFDYLTGKLGNWDSLGTGISSFLDAATATLYGQGDTLWQALRDNTNFSLGKFLMRAMLKVLTFALLVGAVGILAAFMLISQVLIEVAWIIGPIMIPWVIWKPTSFLFFGWLRFFLTAGIYKLLGVLFLWSGQSMFDELTETAKRLGTATDYTWAYGEIFILSVGLVLLMWQIPQVANGLLSGHIGAGLAVRVPRGGGGGKGGGGGGGK